MNPLKDKVAIVGVGATAQGKLPGATPVTLGAEAFKRALDDAGLKKAQIDGLLTMPRTVSPEGALNYLRMGETLDIDPKYTGSMTMGGGTCGALIQNAAMAIACGMANCVACLFADTARSGTYRFARASGWGDSWGIWGMFGAAANSAIAASRHMALYGTRSRHLGHFGPAAHRRNPPQPPHGLVRHAQPAPGQCRSRLPQARRAEPERGDARAPDHRRPPGLARGGGAAAPARLLPDQRWRRLHHPDLGRTGTRPAAAAGADRRHGTGLHHPKHGARGLVVCAAPKGGPRPRLRDGRTGAPGHRCGPVVRQLHDERDPVAGARRFLWRGRGRPVFRRRSYRTGRKVAGEH